MKKKIIIALAVVLSVFVFGMLAHAAFSDISSHKYREAIEFIEGRNVVDGYPDGTFQPDRVMNRAELLTILISHKYPDLPSKNCFTDVRADRWYAKFVCKGRELGIVAGYPDGSFKPSQDVNFVEALIMLQRAYNLPADTSVSPWYKNSVENAGEMNIIPLDTDSFSQRYTRGQMAEMMARLIKYREGTLDEYLGENINRRHTFYTIKENRSPISEPSNNTSRQATYNTTYPSILRNNSCKKQTNNEVALGENINVSFRDGSTYSITLVGLEKETYDENSSFTVQFESDGLKSPTMRRYDLSFLSLNRIVHGGIKIMVNHVNASSRKVQFTLYKDCDLTLDTSAGHKIEDGYNEKQCNFYVGAGEYIVKQCDRIKQSSDSKITAYVDSIYEELDSIELKYIVETEEGNFVSALGKAAFSTNYDYFDEYGSSGRGSFGLNISIDDAGINYDSRNKTAKIIVEENCQGIYNKCISRIGHVGACATLCPYEHTNGYFTTTNANVTVKVPYGHEQWAECNANVLVNGISDSESYLGFDFPYPQAGKVFLEENPHIWNRAHATGWGYVSAIYDDIETSSTPYQLCLEDPDYYAVSKRTDHETNHNIFSPTSLGRLYGSHPGFEEGLVNYIGWPHNDDPLDCSEGGMGDPPEPYGDDTLSGQCFWQSIEEQYGQTVFRRIMQELNESRYIDLNAGRKPARLLFRDIINPIIGSDVLERRAYHWYGFVEDNL